MQSKVKNLHLYKLLACAVTCESGNSNKHTVTALKKNLLEGDNKSIIKGPVETNPARVVTGLEPRTSPYQLRKHL